jgi:protein ImuB
MRRGPARGLSPDAAHGPAHTHAADGVMLWIGLHLPWLSLEAWAATLDAPTRARPLALIDSHRIAQVDGQARARGVRPGHKRATALALAPDLVLGQADPARDAQALAAVAHAALAFTPMVVQPAFTHEVLLEVAASLRCFGGPARLLARLKAALAPLGHGVRIACAPTADGAALLARWRRDLVDGAHATDTAALRTLLDAAPLALLRAGAAHHEALQGMGLHTLGDLRGLPRAGLARRFGPELLAELDRARGDAPDPRQPIVPAPNFDGRIELFTRADTAEQLVAGARILLARLTAWAQARHGRVGGFELRMHHEPRHRVDDRTPAFSVLPIALAEPSADAAHLQLLLAERLGRAPLPAPVLDLSLHCDALVPGAPPNEELFPSRAAERAGLARLVERLQARLGPERVLRLAAVADHRPERATRLVPLGAGGPGVAGGVAPGAAPADAVPPGVHPGLLARPVWLLPEPCALAERDAQPLLDGAPLQLLAGPERIETGWWDGDLVARDYFIAEAADGALVWVWRARLPSGVAPGEPAWFLQGRFA